MVSREELLGALAEAIKEVLNNQNLVIQANTKMVGDLGIESIDFLDIACEIEKTINREMEFKEVFQFVREKSGNQSLNDITIQNVIDFIISKS